MAPKLRENISKRNPKDQVMHLAPVKTFHDKLVSSRYQGETVGMIEVSSYILSKCITSTTGRYSPSTTIIWIGPQQITHRSFVRNLKCNSTMLSIIGITLLGIQLS